METYAWRYHPEFMIRILVNGQDAGEAVKLLPAPASAGIMQNYGLLTRPVPGGLVGYVRQHRDGVNWVPAVDITEARGFAFWLIVQQGAEFPLPDFFDQGSQAFGRQIFYANNLSATGAIDSNLSGNVVVLTSAPVVGDTERGALSSYILSASVAPGDFTQFRAGRILAGAPQGFSITQPVAPTQSKVGLDLSLLPKGAYVIRLEGGSPVEERVFFDQQATGAAVNGIVEIYKDAWQAPPQPREYSIDFPST